MTFSRFTVMSFISANLGIHPSTMLSRLFFGPLNLIDGVRL